MSPVEQRIAIAKACGWKWGPGHVIPRGADQPEYIWHTPDGTPAKSSLPDYLCDLNAMREAEGTLEWNPDDEYCPAGQYYEQLIFVCGNRSDPPDVYEWHLIRATATQRAEAFLRTLNLWRA